MIRDGLGLAVWGLVMGLFGWVMRALSSDEPTPLAPSRSEFLAGRNRAAFVFAPWIIRIGLLALVAGLVVVGIGLIP